MVHWRSICQRYIPCDVDSCKNGFKDPPYVFDYYNVDCFTSHPRSHIDSVPARLVNCLVKALNDKRCVKLPRFIVVIPEWDLLRYLVHNTYGIDVVTRRIMRWITSAMMKAVEAKKDQLYQAKVGSVVSTEPKFVWVKMMQRMNAPDKILTVRNKYNNALEALLAERKGHYVIDVNPILRGPEYFNQFNQLNNDGQLLFWKEVDECIKYYDRRKLTLVPRQDPTDRRAEKSDSAAQLRFKMPPPPPTPRHHTYQYESREERNNSSVHRTRHENNVRMPAAKTWFNRKFLANY